jgi:hypothetical protein
MIVNGLEAEQRAEIEGCRERPRGGRRDRVGAVEILDDLLQHDGQAEGHEDLVGMGALVEVLDQAALHRS